MARVFKRKVLKPLPPGAEIRGEGEARYAHWTDGSGRAQRRPVVDAGGGVQKMPKIFVGEAARWSGQVKVGEGQWKMVTLFTDKTASERELMKLQTDADLRAAGVWTAPMDHAGHPLSKHVADYLASLRLEKVDPETLSLAERNLKKLVEWGGWKRISDVSADAMRSILTMLDRRGLTASYQNGFIKRAKAFVHWLQREGRIVADPLKNLKRVDETKGKRTRARRPLDDNEVLALLDTAPASRRLKYAFPLLAGMRRKELKRMLWGDLRLNAPRPFIKLRAEQTKNSKADVLPLHPYLVKLLGDLQPGIGDQAVVSSLPDVRTLAKDLLAAGVASAATEGGPGRVWIAKGRYIDIADGKGRRADYHALRHTFSANLDRTGCSWTTKKALLRHSSTGVTEGYSHARIEELYTAIERLPSPLGTPLPEAAATAKTGTDDRAVGVEPASLAPLTHHEAVGQGRALSRIDAIASAAGTTGTRTLALGFTGEIGANGGHRRELAGIDLNAVGSADNVSKTRPDTQVV